MVNLVFIFRCSSSTTNPVCVRRVNLLVCSLPLHRHSYIGFIFIFPEKVKQLDLCGQKRSIQWKDAKDVLVKQKQLGELPQSPSCPQLSPEHRHSRQERAGLPQVSSRIARACLRRTFGALVVVSSEKPGAHTTPTSIPQASAAVSVPKRGRLCH